jgi:AraC-like DNA-binding protein
MAACCSLSVDYFSKCFQKTLGQSPQQYLIESKMRSAAAQLLRHPPVAIKQVAHGLGYSCVQTFSRAFRTAVGVSPGAFRRGARPAGGPSPYRVTLLD